MIIRLILAVSVLLWLSSCSSYLPDYSDRDSGYRLVLHKALQVAPGNARVFLQGGRQLPSLAFDQYEPSCSLEVRKLSEQVQTIEPDQFVVNLVQDLIEEVAQWRTLQLASLGLAGAAVDSSPADIFRGYHFWLTSSDQPNVLRMTCRGAFSEPWNAQPPTQVEIAAALGDYATLEGGANLPVPGSY